MQRMSILQMKKKSPWKYLKQPEIKDGRQDGFHDLVETITLELSHTEQ